MDSRAVPAWYKRTYMWAWTPVSLMLLLVPLFIFPRITGPNVNGTFGIIPVLVSA